MPRLGRSTIKYTLFSPGRTKTQPGFWLEAWKFLHRPSRKSSVFRSYWEGFSNHLQPFPTNTWFVELRAPTNAWKFRDFFKSLQLGSKKKMWNFHTKKGKLPWILFFFTAKNQRMKNPGAPGGHIPPRNRTTEIHTWRSSLLFQTWLCQLPRSGEMFEKHRWFPPKTWKFGKPALDIGITFPKNNAWISWSSKVGKKMVQFLEVLVNPPTKVCPISNCVSWK